MIDYTEKEDDFIFEIFDRKMIEMKIDVPELQGHYQLEAEIEKMNQTLTKAKKKIEKEIKDCRKELNKKYKKKSMTKKAAKTRIEVLQNELVKKKESVAKDLKTLNIGQNSSSKLFSKHSFKRYQILDSTLQASFLGSQEII